LIKLPQSETAPQHAIVIEELSAWPNQLRQHIQTFLDAYNFAKRLKTLNGLTPFESVCKAWTKEPNRFKYDPVQLTSGLHT
jgi:hypothetical protein